MDFDGDFTTTQEAAIQMHEWFDSMVQAGFTEDQAMQITIAMLTSEAGKHRDA